jgi:hypothetical protein
MHEAAVFGPGSRLGPLPNPDTVRPLLMKQSGEVHNLFYGRQPKLSWL